MPTVWFALKKSLSLQCKSEPSDVYDPKRKSLFSSRSGCSRSIANLRDVVIHGSKRHLDRPPSCSPRSIGSSEFVNPLSHDVFINSSTCELKISGFHGDHLREREKSPAPAAAPVRAVKKPPLLVGSSDSSHRCHKCGEKFGKWEILETHHFSKHAVTELGENDSSRKIVEIICRSNWTKGEPPSSRKVERVLKVHNLQKTLARFEEHREAVKQRAAKLHKKHPRCLADGNELLRFHGCTLSCSLGAGGGTSLCFAESCRVCRIIRLGFEVGKEEVGVYTASTSGRAMEGVEGERRAMVVCRVIAGRVHRPVEEREMGELDMAGFDSLAGKIGVHANIEELYLLNPRALLPCFVVIYKS